MDRTNCFIRKTIFLIGVFLSLSKSTSAQSDINSLIKTTENRFAGRTSKLIYLQTNKSIYETGEDLWFKAFQLNEQHFTLSDKSKTLYLQMIGEKDSVVWQEKYPIKGGLADGHLYIDEKLPEGVYFLEAYTRHSFHNDSTDLYSIRKIKVLKNISNSPNATNENATDTNNIRFDVFPEGGNLVSGISARLAFKATDSQGYPANIIGTLFQDKKPIAKLETTHQGMGYVMFTPLAGKQYNIELANGQTFSLPEVYPAGISFTLSGQDDEYLTFTVLQSHDIPTQEIYLTGQLRGMVCCAAKGILKDSLIIKIPVKEFTYQGIAEFTLFNNAMLPMAERLVYVHPKKNLHITIEPDKKNYKIREKATLKINVSDDEGKPVKANFGISLFDKAYHNSSDPTLLTHCFLSSQIRGKIYNPEYYFNEENTDRRETMDLLLLTQGWRRYKWSIKEPVCHGEMFLTDEITGRQTIRKNRKKELQDLEQFIQISSPDGNSTFILADTSGYFLIDTEIMNNFRGGYLYAKPMFSGSGYKPALEIDNLFPAINSAKRKKQHYDPVVDVALPKEEARIQAPVISSDSTISLNEVTVTGKGSRPYRDKFMGRLDSLAQLDFGPYVCEHGHLENYLPGFTVHHDPRYCPCPTEPKERNPPVIGKTYYIMKPKYAESNCHLFTVEESRHVVYEGPAYSEEELLRENNYWRTKGYYGVREFYKPDETDMQMSIPDARNTLLWEPNLTTDENGEATITFYCSDINTEFIGILEGTNGLGLIGSARCNFRVIRF